jgi:hypothetical protein
MIFHYFYFKQLVFILFYYFNTCGNLIICKAIINKININNYTHCPMAISWHLLRLFAAFIEQTDYHVYILEIYDKSILLYSIGCLNDK